VVNRAKSDEDKLMSIALDAGAEDLQTEDENFVITTPPNDYEKVKKALEDANVTMDVAEVTMVPQTYVKLEGKEAQQMMRLVETLEDNDDVQNVYANFDIPEEIMDTA
jgi:transcriptional/translational regulatory protein YebC/TACO1